MKLKNARKMGSVAAILFGGFALAGIGIYSASVLDDNAEGSVRESSSAAASPQTQANQNAITEQGNTLSDLSDRVQSWTSGWGFSPFGPGKGTTDEPAPIINGQLTPAPSNQFRIYVANSSGNVSGACSATLIAPTVIMTAAHCLVADIHNAPSNNHDVNLPVDRIFFGFSKTHSFESSDVLKIKAHYAYEHDQITVNRRFRPDYDVALIFLKKSSEIRLTDDKYQKLDDYTSPYSMTEAVISGFAGAPTPFSVIADIGQYAAGNVTTTSRFYKPSIFNTGITIGEYLAQDPNLTSINSFVRLYNDGEPHVQQGDSGGAIVTKDTRRQFGIASLIVPAITRNGTHLKFELHAPVNALRGWIDGNTLVEEATDGRCFPNWPDTKPRNSKTKKCDAARTSDTQEQSDKGSGIGVVDNSAGFGNNPLAQCTEADLQRMVAWNRSNSTQGMTATAKALWEKTSPDLKAWEANLANLENRELNRLLNLPNYGGNSAMDSMRETQMRAMAKAYALANAGPKPQFVYTGPQGAQAIDVTDCVKNLAEQAARNPSFETPSCQSGYAAWRSAILTGSYAPRWTFDEKLAYMNSGSVGNLPFIMRTNSSGMREIAHNTGSVIQNEAGFNNSPGSPAEFGFLVRYGRIPGNTKCDPKPPSTRGDSSPIYFDWDWINWNLNFNRLDWNWYADWLIEQARNNLPNQGSGTGSNNNTGSLRMGNTMPGIRYSDGSQSYSVEWFTNGTTRYVNCIVPSGVISAGSGAIGVYINGTASCRP